MQCQSGPDFSCLQHLPHGIQQGIDLCLSEWRCNITILLEHDALVPPCGAALEK